MSGGTSSVVGGATGKRDRHRTGAGKQARLRLISGGLATILTGVFVAATVLGFPTASDYPSAPPPDVWHQRATAREALWGDPYQPIASMFPFDIYDSGDRVSPRTPAALVLQLPLLLLPADGMLTAVTVVMLGLLLVILGLTARIAATDAGTLLWFGPIIMLSFPVVTGIVHGTGSLALMVALVLAAWAYRDTRWAGLPLGVAAAMRLWPGLVILGFWISGRRRTAVWATGWFVLFNVVGLALPGVGLSGSLQAVLVRGSDWVPHNHNGSLAAVLLPFGVPVLASTAVAVLTVLAVVLKRRHNAIPLTVVGALVASPVSWPIYWLVALPAVIGVWRASPTRWKLLLGLSMVPHSAWTMTPTPLKGLFGFVFLAVLFVALARLEPPRREVA